MLFFFGSTDVLNPYSSVEGIDINSMTPPSEIRMFQLVTNLRLMRVVKRVMDEFKAAGFKMNSDVRSLRLVGGYSEKQIDVMFHFFFTFFFFRSPGRAAGDCEFGARTSKKED